MVFPSLPLRVPLEDRPPKSGADSPMRICGSILKLFCSEALDILLDEGHVYTTMDDTHFDLAL